MRSILITSQGQERNFISACRKKGIEYHRYSGKVFPHYYVEYSAGTEKFFRATDDVSVLTSNPILLDVFLKELGVMGK